jgi:polyprenyl P-hydroxybenzoate/phenylacrylic acid decarboxylase-like protein
VVRAADVTLKERRRLVLMVRETPLHKGHLELMMRCADLGAVILPPMPAFYHGPKTMAKAKIYRFIPTNVTFIDNSSGFASKTVFGAGELPFPG